MDISKLVNSEDLFELNLTGPDTDELVGIRFMIRSTESDAVKRVVRQHSDKFLASREKEADRQQGRGRISRQGGSLRRVLGLARSQLERRKAGMHLREGARGP
ncbi:hypothetical protein Q1M64_21685 [Sinorhizobium meliloti]|nr:hypothetical protein Q1M64_21685 [Sinorhizobium meliloti]